MFSNTRDIALSTLLLIVAVSGILLGILGVLLKLLMPGEHPITLLLTTDSAVASLLSGVGLLALLNHWVTWRRLAGALVVGLAAYHLLHNVLASDMGEGFSLLSGEKRLDSVSAGFLAGTGLCLILGTDRLLSRLGFVIVGLAMATVSALAVIQPQAFEVAFQSASNAAPLLTSGFGIALLLVGLLPWCPPGRIGVLPILAAVTGVLLSVSVWLLLVGNQQQVLQERAAFLLDNIQYGTEQMVRSHLLLIQRLARRVEAAEGDLDHRVLAEDVENYYDDTLSLHSVALLKPNGVWDWQTGRTPAHMLWLDEQVRLPLLQQWLAASYPQPRVILPSPEDPGMAIAAVPLMAGERQLLASFNIASLLRHELRLHLGSYQARLLWRQQELLTIRKGAQQRYEPAAYERLAVRHIGLPGGVSFTIEVYPAHAHVWQEELFIPAVVSVGGLMLTWLLSFSLAMASLAVGRSRQLLAAGNQLAVQQTIQDMVVQEKPLPETLEEICRMVESQLSDSFCAIRLTNRDNDTLEWAAGEGLPEDFREPVEFRDSDAQLTTCGVAAASGELAVSPDLIAETHCDELREQARKQGLHASWSQPILSNNTTLLGTLCVIRGTPGAPSQQELALSTKAVGLTALAVEKYRDRRALRTLERSVEASNNGVLIADASLPDHPIVYCNQAFHKITGYTPEEILGRNCRLLQGEGTDSHTVATVRRHLAEQREVHVTLRNYRKDGTAFWNDLHISPVRDRGGKLTHFVGLLNDISERIAHEEQLTYNASHDQLTGLPNRSMLEDRLTHDFSLAKRHDYRVAVLFVDLDDFKPVNDTLGHDLGDQVLVEVALRLKRGLRATDTVARLGGDEFVVVLPDVPSEQEALTKAETLLSSLARPYQIAGHEIYLTASIGIALSNESTVCPHELIRHADMAMYQAKQKGHNNCQFFTRDITQVLSDRIAMRGELQEALAADQLQLYYQPLLDRERRLVAIEALLRWPHPQRGFISPATFIPLAESTGQIIPMSEWVLERACRDIQTLTQTWTRESLSNVRVAVNLSPLQFHRANFISHLDDTLQRVGLAAQRLDVELTERIFMEDASTAIAILKRLREMGVGVAIDDFGTGFSSLAYLRALPANKVKIDRTFINAVATNPHDEAIVRGIVAMAHYMGLEVVAEGVETEEQWQCLMDLGCDTFQGYLLARPMPLDQLIEFTAELEAMGDAWTWRRDSL